MPGGVPTDVVLPTEDEISLGGLPYSQWAPSPYSKIPGRAFDRVQVHIASHEDTTGLQVVDKSLQAMKVRLWEDIMPMTRNQWRRKHLDDPENFDLACQYLGSVIDTYTYMNLETVQESLKGVFNNIAREWKNFEAALNAIRDTKKEPPISMISLWEEYVRGRWAIMTTRSHDWVMEHVDNLRNILIEQLKQHTPHSLDTLSMEQWNITNKLHTLAEITAQSGYSIVLPMHGYNSHQAAETVDNGLCSPRIEERATAYSIQLKISTRQRLLSSTIKNLMNESESMMSGIADPISMVENINIQKEEQEVLRNTIAKDSTTPLAAAEWILNMKQLIDSPNYGINRWGFITYRITYEQSEEEWAQYLEKLYADVDDWGEDVAGAEMICKMARLRWIDGRDVGIAENDVEAAKRHFLALTKQDDFQDKSDWDEVIFLFADAASVASYLYPIEDASGDLRPHGDFGGFITAVDAPFDPSNPGEHAEESPGFTGRMRISGNFLWSDLFALGKTQAASAEDLWPLAMHHPWQTYVGPVVSKQRELWRETRRKFEHVEEFQRLVP
ncbi:hypothetical protein, variant [Verruconis gallopava]|nr:hypothetical protein, variant [Verruconis gallopava]KIW01709.1 hypothetical protein, variant [Verruconis gallopava]